MENFVDYAALIVSIVAIYISVWTTKAQNRHNALSLMPVCELYTANFDDYLSVELYNKGLGLMEISNIIFKDAHGVEYNNLIDLISSKNGLSYNNISARKTLMSGEKIELIYMKQFTKEQREQVISELYKVKVHIEYKDVYKNKYNFDYPITFVI